MTPAQFNLAGKEKKLKKLYKVRKITERVIKSFTVGRHGFLIFEGLIYFFAWLIHLAEGNFSLKP